MKPKDYDEFKKAVETGFAFAHWCGSGECEEKIKEETRATMRCIPLDQTAVLGHEASASPWRRASTAASRQRTRHLRQGVLILDMPSEF